MTGSRHLGFASSVVEPFVHLGEPDELYHLLGGGGRHAVDYNSAAPHQVSRSVDRHGVLGGVSRWEQDRVTLDQLGTSEGRMFEPGISYFYLVVLGVGAHYRVHVVYWTVVAQLERDAGFFLGEEGVVVPDLGHAEAGSGGVEDLRGEALESGASDDVTLQSNSEPVGAHVGRQVESDDVLVLGVSVCSQTFVM